MVVEKGPDWWVKIADFGISKRRHDVTTLQTLQRGTMGFAAPEAVGISADGEDGTYSAAVDIWSLGAVAFMMLTGRGAFGNFAELAGYCSGTRAFPIQKLERASVSSEGQSFVASLMMLAPEARPTADEALQHPWMDVVISSTENAEAKHPEAM
jgi:serine/threonine protein kinase